MQNPDPQQFTVEEQEGVAAFLAETTLFLGPDPEIMNDHRMAPRTAEEERLLAVRSTPTPSTGSASGWGPASMRPLR
jgi:hypothetical protein